MGAGRGKLAGLVLTRTIVMHDVYGRERSGQVIRLPHVVDDLRTDALALARRYPARSRRLARLFSCARRSGLGALATSRYACRRRTSRAAPTFGLRSTLASFGRSRAIRTTRTGALFPLIMATFFATQAALAYLIVEVHGGTATNTASGSPWPGAFLRSGELCERALGGRFDGSYLASSIVPRHRRGPAWRPQLPRMEHRGGLRSDPSSCASSAHWLSRRCRPKPWRAAGALGRGLGPDEPGMQMAIGAGVVFSSVGFTQTARTLPTVSPDAHRLPAVALRTKRRRGLRGEADPRSLDQRAAVSNPRMPSARVAFVVAEVLPQRRVGQVHRKARAPGEVIRACGASLAQDREAFLDRRVNAFMLNTAPRCASRATARMKALFATARYSQDTPPENGTS